MSPVKLLFGQPAVYEPPGVGERVMDAKGFPVALDCRERRTEAAPVQGQKQR